MFTLLICFVGMFGGSVAIGALIHSRAFRAGVSAAIFFGILTLPFSAAGVMAITIGSVAGVIGGIALLVCAIVAIAHMVAEAVDSVRSDAERALRWMLDRA